MKLFRILPLVVGSAVAVFASTSPVRALTYSYSNNTGYLPTDVVDTPLYIQQFDSSQGTLNSVDLVFTGDLLSNISLLNKGSRPINTVVDVSAEADLTLSGLSLFSIYPDSTYYYTVPTLSSQPNQPILVNNLTATISNTQTLTSNLSPFIGSGNLAFLVSVFSTSSVTGSGNLLPTVDTSGNGTLQVTYNYTATNSTPVPFDIPGGATIPALGSVLALVAMRKARKSLDICYSARQLDEADSLPIHS